MKLHYYPETDSLYVEFRERPSVDTREIAVDVRLDLDADGRPVGLDIDHASQILDLHTVKTDGLPLAPADLAHGHAMAERPQRGGRRLMIAPAKALSLLGVLAALAPVDEEFPPIAELNLDPVEL